MALGDITKVGDQTRIELMASVTAANSPPSGASAGLSTDQIKAAFGGKIPDALTLQIASTAGSGTMVCTAVLWVYASGGWGRPGNGATSSVKGLINEGNSIDEVSANYINHMEEVRYLGHFERVYLEIATIGGTNTAVTGYLLGQQRYGSY